MGEAIARISKDRTFVSLLVLAGERLRCLSPSPVDLTAAAADYNLARATEVQAKLGDNDRFPVEKIDARSQAGVRHTGSSFLVRDLRLRPLPAASD